MKLALDKRTLDVDGRLHISDCRLTAARVNEYLGSEIPDVQGLDPSRLYRLFRDPAALEAAVPLFENMPLTAAHVPVSAADPQKFYTIGAVSNARWEPPYVIADIAIWDGEAIKRVQDGSQKEISVGYRYVADMRPGVTPDGEPFDSRMLEIQPNHIAVVGQARVGPDCVVGDEEFRTMNLAARVAAAIAPYLKPDAERGKLILALDAALESETEEERQAAADKARKFYGRDEGAWAALNAADRQKARDEWQAGRKAKDVDHRDDFNGAKDAARQEVAALFQARQDVAPVVGVVSGLDSATQVYEFALRHMKIRTDDVPATAYRRLFEVAREKRAAPAAAFDSAPTFHSIASIFRPVEQHE